MDIPHEIAELTSKYTNIPPEEVLKQIGYQYSGKVIFSTSFSLEDQVITDMVFRNDIPIKVFTIDTGRLFPEIYKVFNQTIEKYKNKITVYFPDTQSIENLITQKGPFSFYHSVENRKECCHVRKVKPLERAIKGYTCWISGIRAEHSEERGKQELFMWDDKHQIIKFSPLLNWDNKVIRNYLSDHRVPYNEMYDKGFTSIGCLPCTRITKPGEDPRAGRWWWENNSKKECGLHS